MLPHIRDEKRNVTPEKAIKILAKHGTDLTFSEAKIMLEFLYKLANLSVSQANKRAIKHHKQGLEERKNGKTKIQIL
ncbi:hypothetical protein [Pedobacter sp. Hv1]|uniref:hypothetical protein n=1 Tax=Pedobacter sp. Hv1 TaxID=1740090 RepID=UPI0006D8C06F|nr:hypothetical protein [Pedobacter sp. Hv1]KQC02053.1 hypothetical protein AQF98_00325 [Pedobacter sp. Hv1]